MSCCAAPVDMSDKTYYAAVEHEVFVEKKVELGPKKHSRHIMSWLPKTTAKAVVVIAHGLHEHGMRYYTVAHALTAKGFAVYALDHDGHGRSCPESERGFVGDHRVLVEDFVALAEYARNQQGAGTVPLYVLGHSMGTLVSMLAVEKIPDVSAMVLSGCAVHAGPAAASPFGCTCLFPLVQGAVGESMLGCMAACAPKAPAAPIIVEGITSDAASLEILLKDPHRYAGDVMNKTAAEVLAMINAVKGKVNSVVTMPVFLMHGTDDELCFPDGSEWVRDHAGTPLEFAKIQMFKGNRHEIFHEKKVTKVGDVDYPEGVVEAIVVLVDYLEDQFARREIITADLKQSTKRGFPTLSSLLPPVKFKHAGAKSPQTRERTKLEISLPTSNNAIL